jgi:UDP-3-O-[3-hydroxymyristoyl] glucosamine N-acyltransferase
MTVQEEISTYNFRFFSKKKEFITLNEISELIPIKNIGLLNKNQKIFNLTTLAKATKNDISFLSNVKYLKDLKTSEAGFCFIEEKYIQYLSKNTQAIIVDNPHYSYTVFLKEMYLIPIFLVEPNISNKATVHETAKIGKNVEIQAGAFIDKNVNIGDNCKICANVVINHDCVIGNDTYIGANTTISYAEIGQNVIIHNGVNIGQCGFGFTYSNGVNHKVPQLGIVKIEDYVEVGAGSCIDRGAFENTNIGYSTKIDNLVHIAHGVQVGSGCFLAAQTGIAGSAEIGNFVQLGGQVGIAGHIKIGDMVQVAAKSGVINDIEAKSAIGGYPAILLRDWHKSTIIMKKLLTTKIKK